MDKIIKKNEGTLTPISGLENLDNEDIAIPTLFPDAKMGFFRDSLNEDSKKNEIKGTLLTFNKGWKLREGDPPVTKCRSFDGKSGTFGTACDGCPKRIRQQDSKDFCKRVYDFLFLPEGETMPYIISINQVTSLGEIKKYLTLFGKKLKRPLFSAVTTISLEETANKKGQSYFVVKFEKGEDLPSETANKYNEIMETYRFKKSSEMEDVEDQPVKEEAISMDDIPTTTPF